LENFAISLGDTYSPFVINDMEITPPKPPKHRVPLLFTIENHFIPLSPKLNALAI